MPWSISIGETLNGQRQSKQQYLMKSVDAHETIEELYTIVHLKVLHVRQ